MTETGYGGGGYAYTRAVIPSAPILEEYSSEAVRLTIGSDENPAHTEYALVNQTDGTYAAAGGNSSESAVWQTRAGWATITLTGLSPATTYDVTVKARNQDGIETETGPARQVTTFYAATNDLTIFLTIVKASSTVSAPLFMRNVTDGVRIAGKYLHELGFVVSRISGLEAPRIVPDEELVPGGHTWHVWDEYFAPKRIVLEGHVHGSTPADLRLRLAYLKSFLATFEGDPWRSSAPVRLERSDIPGRYWTAYYEHLDQVEPMGRRNTATSARVTVTMKCPMPFAAACEVTRMTCVPEPGLFSIVDLGNAPSDAVYVITGAATNPSFTVGDMVFHCDFTSGLTCTDQENAAGTGTFTPTENEAAAYRTTETGTGLLVAGTDTIGFSCTGNTSDGTWITVIAPQWQSSGQEHDVVILEHRYDGDNYLRLYWDASEDTWVFRKRANGVIHEISSSPQSFTKDTRIMLGFVYDNTNAGGMKLFIDGIQDGVAIDSAVLDNPPSSLTLHAGDDSMQPNVIYDVIAGWSRMFSTDEMLKIASDPQSARNLNVTVSYEGILNTGDRLTLDSRLKTAVLFDVSSGTTSNVLGNITGTIPVLTPGRRRTASDRTQTILSTATSAAGMEVRFNRHYL